MATCRIHDSKPKACRDWPLTEGTMALVKDVCGFWFEDGVRRGECKRCGACCEKVWLYLDGYAEKIRGERCPHLGGGE